MSRKYTWKIFDINWRSGGLKKTRFNANSRDCRMKRINFRFMLIYVANGKRRRMRPSSTVSMSDIHERGTQCDIITR